MTWLFNLYSCHSFKHCWSGSGHRLPGPACRPGQAARGFWPEEKEEIDPGPAESDNEFLIRLC